MDLVRTPFFAKHFTMPGTRDCSPLRRGFIHLQERLDLHERLRYCIGRLNDTIDSLRRLDGRKMIDAAKCRFVITRCQYDLLSVQCEDLPNELCRLTLIIYTITILDERPLQKPAYDHLLWKFQDLWGKYDREHSVGLSPHFKMWALVAATPICRTPKIRNWCILETSRALARLEINSVDALTAFAEDFLPLCDVRCRHVWHQCRASGQQNA